MIILSFFTYPHFVPNPIKALFVFKHNLRYFGWEPGGLWLRTLFCISLDTIYNRCTRWATMRRLPKQEWFHRWRPLTFFSLIIFSDCFSLVLHLASVSVTSIRQYLDPTRAVQLLQDGTSICAIARRFAVSPSTVSRAWRRFQKTDSYSRRTRQGRRRSLTQQ